MWERSRPDYHQLVATTVARLNKETGGARCAVVERARAMAYRGAQRCEYLAHQAPYGCWLAGRSVTCAGAAVSS